MVASPRKKTGRRGTLLIVLTAAVTLPALLLALGLSNLNPTMINMAEARASQLAVTAINRAVDEVIGATLRYSDLVSVSLDGDGNVSMLQANTILMNDLASRTALAAQRNLGDLADQGISLPLGAALGVGVFSGYGPRIRINVLPVGTVVTKFVTDFETAGINQTRHEISLESTITMRIIVPAGAQAVQVHVYMPIAESIIVGKVPSSYVNVPDVDSMLNLLP
ncbi:MAG: sporulation protein YunB [Clostridiales bacterium]|nr:sporulation protein YunB [Clostridiales bacterium]